MASFTFNGFTTGSSVAISAAQGAETANGSVTSWGQSTMATSLEISKVEAPVKVAPAFVWFEATNLNGFDVQEATGAGDPSFDGITYVWTIAGNPLPDYSDPNIPDAWRNANVAYGKKVGFFFPDPNITYSIRCWAIDQSGNSAEATVDFTASDADSEYANTATICLDPSASFAGAPTGAQQVTTLGAAQSAINAASGGCRLLIARDQVINNVKIDGRGGKLRHVGAFGPGIHRPVLKASHSTGAIFDFMRSTAPQLVISDIDCQGQWDAASETGYPSSSPLNATTSSLLHLAVWNCRFSGFSAFTLAINSATTWIAGIGRTVITNWQDYGTYIPPAAQARIGWLGCDVAQNVNALNDYTGNRNGLMNQQGPLRAPAYGTLYLGGCSFMSRGGWSGGTDQQCLRLNSECRDDVETIVERCTLEGGAQQLKMSGSNSGVEERPGSHLFDKVLLMAGGGKTGFQLATAHFGGTTFRNTVFAMPNVANKAGLGLRECCNLQPDVPVAGNLTVSVKFVQCTSLDLRDTGNDAGDDPRLFDPAPFLEFTDENNLVHGPGLDTPVAANAMDLSNSITGFTPRYAGVRPNFPFESGSLSQTVGHGDSFTLTYPSGTNQAYWLAISGSDQSHGIKMGNKNHYAAFDGGFSVSFEASQVRITNLSGSAWSSGSAWVLRLDRTSNLPAMDGTYGNPGTLPLPRPTAGSPVAGDGDLGMRAYDDFLGAIRPGPGGTDHLGQARPATGNSSGGLLP